MADSIFGDKNIDNTSSGNIFDNNDADTKDTQIVTPVDNSVNTSSDIYSEQELNDPNAINVTIADQTSPLVILFGPPTCGKTMTLVRLTRYLNRLSYTVSPVRTFRPSYDKNYTAICDGFDELINSDDAASGTNRINFMLVEVMKNGRRICQLLEAPGEFYFNRTKPADKFPNFINTIINRNNRKIWALMVEPNWYQNSDRKNYVNKIKYLKTRQRATDKNIIVFNKIDKTNFVYGPGNIHLKGAMKDVNDLYPGLFGMFKNENPITSLWRSYNCGFVPFQTGDYSEAASGKKTFQEGPDEYPRLLWNTILKNIKG